MENIYILDPTKKDAIARFRGGGRMIQILKENVAHHTTFITDFAQVAKKDILLIPCFNPFQKPILSKRIAKKQIIMIFDIIPLKYPAHFTIGIKGKINLLLNKKALRYYDSIITISRQSKQDIINYLNVPAEKIKVIYPTASNVFLNNKKPIPTNSIKYCIYVGDVNWNKNLVNLAKAIKIANVPCVFVGKMFQLTLDFQLFSHSWQKEFRNFLKEINDDPHFIFAGYKTDNELIKLYQQSYINILISRDEGFGFSYLEASILGCPSVLSDIDIFHETAKNSALFANPDDPKDIASKIRQIFDDDELCNKLLFEAQERVKYFSAEKFKREWANLF